MDQIKFKVTGLIPMMLHNNQMADPLNIYKKASAQFTSKRKKTDADELMIARIEWEAGINQRQVVVEYLAAIKTAVSLALDLQRHALRMYRKVKVMLLSGGEAGCRIATGRACRGPGSWPDLYAHVRTAFVNRYDLVSLQLQEAIQHGYFLQQYQVGLQE